MRSLSIDAIELLFTVRFRVVPSADVLVVNDHLLDAQTTLVAFEQVAPRARVLHLMDGGEALQYLFSTGVFAGRSTDMPQLVVLSLEMTSIGGLCVLDLMRAHPLTCKVPVILASIEGDPGTYRRHNKFDASAYVTLPCNFRRYCAVIEACTQRWLPWALRPCGVESARSAHASLVSRWQRPQPAPA